MRVALALPALWFATLLAGCTGELISTGLLEDVEAGVVVLEGDELVAELRDSPVRESPEPFVRLGLVWDAEVAFSK